MFSLWSYDILHKDLGQWMGRVEVEREGIKFHLFIYIQYIHNIVGTKYVRDKGRKLH